MKPFNSMIRKVIAGDTIGGTLFLVAVCILLVGCPRSPDPQAAQQCRNQYNRCMEQCRAERRDALTITDAAAILCGSNHEAAFLACKAAHPNDVIARRACCRRANAVAIKCYAAVQAQPEADRQVYDDCADQCSAQWYECMYM